MEKESNCWSDLADVLHAGVDRVLLYGPPGTGKTFAALHTGLHDAAQRVVCTEDLSAGEITGSWIPTKQGEFHWLEGPAIRAWRGSRGGGTRLVIDELERASGDALSTLLAMTDSPESARWQNPETLEWVRPGSHFSVIVTSNLEDSDDIPTPLRDRFPVQIRVDRPPARAVARLSVDLRDAALSGSLGPSSRRVSLRTFFALDRLRQVHGLERAVSLIFPDAEQQDFLDALRIGAVEHG